MLSKVFTIILIYLRFKLISTQNELNNEYPFWSFNELIPKDYNKHIVPVVNGSQPIISIGIEVYDLVSVVESGQVCTQQLYATIILNSGHI
jgi:hypothetical protein